MALVWAAIFNIGQHKADIAVAFEKVGEAPRRNSQVDESEAKDRKRLLDSPAHHRTASLTSDFRALAFFRIEIRLPNSSPTDCFMKIALPLIRCSSTDSED